MFFPSANEKFGAARSEGEGFGSVPGAGGRDRRNNSQENGPLHRKMAMKLFLFLMFIFLAVAPSSSNHIFVALTPAGEILFFQHRDGPWVPNLRLLHKYPSMMPRMRVDAGAIKFVLRGSHVMCPGLTSPGGAMDQVETGQVVQLVAEGKVHACAIGITTMSTSEIRKVNKDVCIESLTYLGDGLWNTPSLD
eukprot:GHVT01101102.1.p1 GENE.GHVT01101102.1~~GHVT01101102.1.p1  ORF type:complete len:192 (+),score=29.45 GHVT01101102.1:293-868(+)